MGWGSLGLRVGLGDLGFETQDVTLKVHVPQKVGTLERDLYGHMGIYGVQGLGFSVECPCTQ